MHKSGIVSMENLFEIKAPLASFDTVDLGDDDQPYTGGTVEYMPVTPATPDESFAESVDSQSSNTSHNVDSELHGEEHSESDAVADLSGTDKHADEIDGVKAENTAQTGSAETNSSENSAAGAIDILQKLKLKSKKHKETESKVKYQQIENSSDLSDHEKSHVPDLNLVSSYKICDSDTDSSDSDSGFVRTGHISALKGLKKGTRKKTKKAAKVREIYNLSTPDSTPNASPKVFRPVLPPPLTEEERSQQSKRKAYEKRLQRLQVTTAPIERPRSTTPIDIFGLEDYVNISSPEKTPQHSNLEKLRITLPPEEFALKGQSPRKSSRFTESHDPHVFSFNEDLLFTHTKSALVVQDDMSKGHSPKKILIPPTLSPALSPRSQRCSTALNLSPRSPRYYFTPPKTHKHIHVGDHWAKFDETDNAKDLSEKNDEEKAPKSNATHLKENFSADSFDQVAKDKLLNEEEILTVNIEVVNETQVCDIKCETVTKDDVTSYESDKNQKKTVTVELAAYDSGDSGTNPIFTDFDMDNSNDPIVRNSEDDIWLPHECNTQSDMKSETVLNSNIEGNLGEALKEILDNAFKEENFDCKLDEKESICESISDNKTLTDTISDRKETFVTDKIDQINL